MVIWRGGGCLMAIIIVACFGITQYAIDTAMRNPGFYTAHGWPKSVALWIAAMLVWLYNKKNFTTDELNTPTLTRMEGDKLGKEFMAAQHSLFFINVKYWPLLLAVLGFISLFF